MHRTVKEHPFETNYSHDELERALANRAGPVGAAIVADPRYAGSVPTGLLISTAWAYSIREYGAMRRFLNLAAEYGAVPFQVSDRQGTATFRIDGRDYEGPCGPVNSYVSEWSWIRVFFVIQLTRRAELLPSLLEFPRASILKSPGGDDKYGIELCDALRYFCLGDERWRESLDACEALMEPQHLSELAWSGMRRPFIAMLRAVDAGDQTKFDDGYEAALKAHKAHFGRGKNKKVGTSLLAFEAMGMAALGVSRGMQLQVHSGYAPDWLVLGQGAP